MKHYDVVAAIVCMDDKILCMQKGKTKFEYTSYKFEFPGGKIEAGETPEQALKRELMEEMEYDVNVGKRLVTVDYTYQDFSISLTAFVCSAKNRNFKMNEHIGYRWCCKDELGKLDWAAADIGIVKAITNQDSASLIVG